MSKRFRPSNLGESKIISKIASSKEYERRKSINAVAEKPEELSNYIAMKLVENEVKSTKEKVQNLNTIVMDMIVMDMIVMVGIKTDMIVKD